MTKLQKTVICTLLALFQLPPQMLERAKPLGPQLNKKTKGVLDKGLLTGLLFGFGYQHPHSFWGT